MAAGDGAAVAMLLRPQPVVRTGAQLANGAFPSTRLGRTGARKPFCGKVFFVARRNQNRKVEVTVGDIFASRPGIAAGHRAIPRGGGSATPRRKAPF
jgi:hypothetical protein